MQQNLLDSIKESEKKIIDLLSDIDTATLLRWINRATYLTNEHRDVLDNEQKGECHYLLYKMMDSWVSPLIGVTDLQERAAKIEEEALFPLDSADDAKVAITGIVSAYLVDFRTKGSTNEDVTAFMPIAAQLMIITQEYQLLDACRMKLIIEKAKEIDKAKAA